MIITRRQLLAAGLAASVAAQASAAVAFLQVEASPLLVLVDEELLDKSLLARLAAQGFRTELQPVSDCSAVDFGLLTSRIQQAGRVVGLLGPVNYALIMEALRFMGARVLIDRLASEITEANGTRELLALRNAIGPAVAGMQAVAATLGD